MVKKLGRPVPPKVTPEIRLKIIEFRKEGSTMKQIAERLDLSISTVSKVLIKGEKL